MRHLVFHDLLLFRKCPFAFWHGVRSDTEPLAGRVPLPEEAAEALRRGGVADEGLFLYRKEICRNHCVAKADLLIGSCEDLELVIDSNALFLRESVVLEAAYIACVLGKAGLSIHRFTALVLNQEYTRQETIDWKLLYKEQDITKRVQRCLSTVRAQIAAMHTIGRSVKPPAYELREICLKPHECAFWRTCSENLPYPHVFSFVGMSNRRKFSLYRKGTISFAQCLDSAKLAKPQRMQAIYALEHRPPYIDREAVRMFLSTTWYPMAFLDFESFQPPIPLFSGMRPYEQCAFLYSLKILRDRDAVCEQMEHFVPYGTDPRRILAEALCAEIPRDACVLVYSSGLEKKVLTKLAAEFPDLREHLQEINDHIRDIMPLFRDRHYYDWLMQGSCSLKHVAPVFDKHLRYEALRSVHDGEESMHAYMTIPLLSAEQREELEDDLCDYCAMDTRSLVCIFQALERYMEASDNSDALQHE